jgi:hypothetical protein
MHNSSIAQSISSYFSSINSRNGHSHHVRSIKHHQSLLKQPSLFKASNNYMNLHPQISQLLHNLSSRWLSILMSHSNRLSFPKKTPHSSWQAIWIYSLTPTIPKTTSHKMLGPSPFFLNYSTTTLMSGNYSSNSQPIWKSSKMSIHLRSSKVIST